MNKANCETCYYKHLNKNETGHCYMFREEPDFTCKQWKSGLPVKDKINLFNELINLNADRTD